MTDQELHQLAQQLATDAGAAVYAPLREVVGVSLAYEELDDLVRAALAHGLKMGAGACEAQAERWPESIEKRYAAFECVAALRDLGTDLDKALTRHGELR